MVQYVLLIAIALTAQAVLALIKLARNISKARATGLPYTISPIHELEGWAYLTDPLLRWWCRNHLLKKGQGWPRWARFMVKDWHYEDKGRAHAEFGEVFLVVSPGGLVCYVGNAKTAMNVVSRRKAFVKPPEKMKMLEPFGPNVVSTDGDLWRFHLRITLPPFGEAVQQLVWDETERQTGMMAASWAKSSGAGSLKHNIYTLTVNTMSLAGFGRQADWVEDSKAVPQGHSLSLVAAIFGVVMHLPHILLMPKWLLRNSPWKIAHTAYVEFEQYMNELLAEAKAGLQRGVKTESGAARENLLTAVLRSSEEGAKQAVAGPGGRTSLTDEEIKGNVFIFLLAGYDTTANTILFCCIMLALYSDVQDQIIEEADRIRKEAREAGREELSYTEDLPKFRYLIAFMYEVMRVFPIVIPIGRTTVEPQDLLVHDSITGTTRNVALPANTGVIVNNTAIHYSEKNWPSPHIFEPRRWLVNEPNTFDPSQPVSAAQETEIKAGTASIPGHIKGTFMTFNEGPRACLGRHFARVEFVAFFARLLRDHRLRLDDGVSAAVVERTMRLVSGGSPVTLIPPEDVPVCLVPRGNDMMRVIREEWVVDG